MRTRAAACLAFALLLLPSSWLSGHVVAAAPASETVAFLAASSLPARPPSYPRAAAAAAGSTAAYYPLAIATALLIVGGVLAMSRSKPRLDPELTYLADKSARVRALAREGRAGPDDLMHLSALDSRGQWWRIDPRSGAWQRYSGGIWRSARNPTSRWRSLQLAGLFLVLAGLGTAVILLLSLTGVVAYQ